MRHKRKPKSPVRFVVLAGLIVLSAALSLAAPLRIVSLTSPATETIYMLGAEASLVGVTDVCVFPERVIKDRESGRVKVVGGFSKVDFALIDEMKPDVIFTSTAFQRNLAQQLRAKGYKVIHQEPSSLADVLTAVEEIGAAIERTDQARQFTAKSLAEIEQIKAKASQLPQVRVYIEINHMGPWTSGKKSYVNDVIRDAGGINVFEDDSRDVFKTTNNEVRRRNPEVILSPIWLDAHIGGLDGITTISEITSRRGFKGIKAVRDGRVLYYDSALLKHGGPREVLAIRKLAHLLHPLEFPDPADTIPWELGRIQ